MNTSKNVLPERSRWLSVWPQWPDQLRWLPFVLPLVVYMACGYLEPTPPSPDGNRAARQTVSTPEQPTSADSKRAQLTYPQAYTLKLVATLAALIVVFPILTEVHGRVGWAPALAVGLVGGPLWIALAKWPLVEQALSSVGLATWLNSGARAAFNPLAAWDATDPRLVAFLAIRFAGLVVVVPLIEELFLRGFLMRFVVRGDWWNVKLGDVTWLAGIAVALYGVLSHPAEPLAAVVWFTMVTLLYAKTRSFWDCVVVHAITNLGLGVYVLAWHDWTLW